MMTQYTRILLVLALAATLAQAGTARGDTAGELNDRGIAAIKRGDYAAAVRHLEAARALRPADATLKRNLAMAYNTWGVALNERGEFPEAEAHVLKALEIEPGDRTARRNLSAVRWNWGVTLMQQGEHAEAEDRFILARSTARRDELERIDKGRAENLTLLARAYVAENRDERAKDALNQALDIYADSVPAIVEMGRILYNEHKTAEALAYWLAAQEIDPDQPELNALVDKVTREALTEVTFDRRESGDFVVSYEGQENEALAREALEILTRASSELERELRVRPSRPVGVVFYTKDQYADVTMAPHWSGAVYDGKIRIPWAGGDMTDAQRERLIVMLRHEYIHALVVELAGPNAPAWLNEGLATYFEIDRLERRQRGHTESVKLAGLARSGHLPGIADLPARFTDIQEGWKARRAYLISRGFVGYLVERHRSGKIRRVLEHLGAGWTMDNALRDAYGRGLRDLDAEWRKTLR